MDITASQAPCDSEAREQGCVPGNTDRSFRLEHWEYDSERIEGFSYDVGGVLMASAGAADESEPVTVLTHWQLSPRQLVCLRDSEDPNCSQVFAIHDVQYGALRELAFAPSRRTSPFALGWLRNRLAR
ncbi:hypothetical protein ACFWP3_39855 [Streptomyces sp. NPDC058525]|uniref:hypothetical protein n=1 Tax=Streptomyces sp. NPDC058525 TaxID=3346538 RepID=UPI00364E6AFE